MDLVANYRPARDGVKKHNVVTWQCVLCQLSWSNHQPATFDQFTFTRPIWDSIHIWRPSQGSASGPAPFRLSYLGLEYSQPQCSMVARSMCHHFRDPPPALLFALLFARAFFAAVRTSWSVSACLVAHRCLAIAVWRLVGNGSKEQCSRRAMSSQCCNATV